MKTILENIKNQKNGFRLGEIWKNSANAVGAIVPIIAETKEARDYILIEELKDYTVTDTGDINRIKINTVSDKPIFVRVGSCFKGDGTQSRAVEASIIVPVTKDQKAEVEIPSRCIHASHGISAGSKFKMEGYAKGRVASSLLAKAGQSAVWKGVTDEQERSFRRLKTWAKRRSGAMRNFTMDNLREERERGLVIDNHLGNREKIRNIKEKLDITLKKTPCIENQVGAVVLDGEGVSAIELFNHPDSWKAFHESIIESYEDILTEEVDKELYKINKEAIPGKISEFIGQIYGCKKQESYKTDAGSTYSLTSEKVIGEYTTFNGKAIHLLFMRNEGG